MDAAAKKIPEQLIYEMVNGDPIYYSGYKAYLAGEKELDEIMGSSYLEAVIGTQLVILLSRLIDRKEYQIFSNEVGLKFGKNSWRAVAS